MSRSGYIDLDALDKKIEAEVKSLDQMILGGKCTDYVSYRARCAERAGILKGRDAVIVLLKEDDDGD